MISRFGKRGTVGSIMNAISNTVMSRARDMNNLLSK